MTERIWRAVLPAILLGLTATACANATSDATTGAPEISEAPAVVAAPTEEEAASAVEAAQPEEETTTTAVEDLVVEEVSEPADTAPPETEPPTTTEAGPIEEEAEPVLEEPLVQASPLFEGDFVDLNGQSIDLASFEGQDVVLWFWAPW